jgi:hypothetical protein
MSQEKPMAVHRPNYFLEFIVVFLGVTISFWLSEWNEGRKTQELHKEDVVSLLEDLDRDQERLEHVYGQAQKGKDRSQRVLNNIMAFREGDADYTTFTDSLIEIGYLYGYSTFFMNSATYKSLIGSTRIQEFPHEINKQVRDYYEYVSKRVEDNNDIVDAIALKYYNEFNPYCLMANDREEAMTLAERRRYFDHPDTREHYSGLPFYHQTLALHDRTDVHMAQVKEYIKIRAGVEEMLRQYAEELLGHPVDLAVTDNEV